MSVSVESGLFLSPFDDYRLITVSAAKDSSISEFTCVCFLLWSLSVFDHVASGLFGVT